MATRELASRLPTSLRMAWVRVAMLAVVTLAATGFGSSSASAQTMPGSGANTVPVLKGLDAPVVVQPRTTGDGTTALPQDPVPEYEGKRGPRQPPPNSPQRMR